MKNSSRFFYSILFILALVLFLVNPKRYMDATIDGAIIFYKNVFPTLFPFFILTRILTVLGVGTMLSKVLRKPVKILYNTSELGGYIFAISCLSGYPIGAKMVSEFVESGDMAIEEAKSVIAFTSTSGPLFILGTIGVKMLSDYRAGIIILVAHFFSAIMNGLVYMGKSLSNTKLQLSLYNCDNFFNDAISSTCHSILQVGASIIFLNVMIVALKEIKIIDVFSYLLSVAGLEDAVSNGISVGLVEITKGASLLSSQCKIKDIIVPLCTIISFGGVSVMVQSMGFLRKAGISSSYYLLTKTSQAIFAYAISTLFVAILY